jgi:hypothetical protein
MQGFKRQLLGNRDSSLAYRLPQNDISLIGDRIRQFATIQRNEAGHNGNRVGAVRIKRVMTLSTGVSSDLAHDKRKIVLGQVLQRRRLSHPLTISALNRYAAEHEKQF